MSSVIDGNVIRSVREAKGWDQLTLAQAAGINPSVVSRLERGLQDDLRASVLVALARALEVPVDSLLHPSLRQAPTALTPELVEVLADLARLSPAMQQQVAAILRGYLSTLPE
jgi:transcriptional regulator with XRE-family HTH domain